ncbi:acyl-CoA dehydratase activase [Lentisphaerota bacterium WC36G]|nr:acyl-CoA dehydratase activase [Lentisphaerae bacterium WC36]
MSYFLGIDIGSTTTKMALLKNDELLAYRVTATGVSCQETSLSLLESILKEHSLERSEIKRVMATGYGRRLIDFADDIISEITANVKGTVWSCPELNGNVRTIINIGGQDSKVISLDEHGVTQNFAMNDKCAAGTGRFLETITRILQIDVKDLGPLSKQSEIPLKINSTCAVFAESEIISLVARKKTSADIIAGAHFSIARRIGKMARRMGIKESIVFDGGPALNKGLVKAFEDELAIEIHVPKWPQITTAIGAAILARNEWEYQQNA